MFKFTNGELLNIQYKLDSWGYNTDLEVLKDVVELLSDTIRERNNLVISMKRGNPELNGWNLKVKDLVDIQNRLNKLGYEADLEVIEDVLICANQIGDD